MQNNTLILLGVLAACLTLLSFFLTNTQQTAIADWNVRAWSAIDQVQRSMASTKLFQMLVEDGPITTAGALIIALCGGFFFTTVFGTTFLFSIAPFIGGILKNEDMVLVMLWGSIALVGLWGLCTSLKMTFLAFAGTAMACCIVPLLIIEFFVRRIAEHERGPIIALGIVATALVSLLKSIL